MVAEQWTNTFNSTNMSLIPAKGNNMKPFKCFLPKIIFGCEEFQNLGTYVQEMGEKAFIVIDPFLVKSGYDQTIHLMLEKANIQYHTYSDVKPDPDCFDVDAAAKIARQEGCNLIVAVGGGSAIDFGKGVAVMINHEGTCWEYTRRKDHMPKEPGKATLPIVAIPTTAGTGSEITHYAVFSNSKIREKSTIVSEWIVPKLAIVDPELTYSCPSKITALSGVDALAHSIEAFININASPFVKMTALESIKLVAANLPIAVSDGKNSKARQNVAWASTLGGIAIAHANPTLPHALGQAAGGFVHAAHGSSIAACLSHILNISYSSALTDFAEIAKAMDPDIKADTIDKQAKAAADLVADLLDEIQVKIRFRDLGLKKEDIERVTKIALTGYFTGISCHPKKVTEAEIIQIYSACL
jgi:alcohol dehydrogenase class IV